MYVCTYVRMYVCTYVRMYVCTLLNCVSGVCSDLEIQQVVEQFSYMSKIYFLVFHYSWILFLIVYP